MYNLLSKGCVSNELGVRPLECKPWFASWQGKPWTPTSQLKMKHTLIEIDPNLA
jgi:hypothetical protein